MLQLSVEMLWPTLFIQIYLAGLGRKIHLVTGQILESEYLIGVLDFYGLESFKTNIFEQLHTNLTNESNSSILISIFL